MVQLLRKTREESCLICCHVACEDKEKKRKKELKNLIDLFDLPPQQKKSNKKLIEKNLYLFIDCLID